jgi:solute:Na+ symporter, SSS family
MSLLDWFIVLLINGGIVLYGLVAFREKQESFDWYLAAKSMPWWAIGLSAFGTAVDSGDYVAIAGGAYSLGLSQLSQWWLGIAVGWFVLGFFVIIPMYRSGVFTNAEWLEFRFGPSVRVMAVLINIQSRTNVLGNIFFSMFLMLSVLAGIDPQWCWVIVGFIAFTAILYIMRGGLQAGVFTDAMQAVAMIVASLVLWSVVWYSTGGWDGLHARLSAVDPALPGRLLHVGGYSPDGVPPVIVVFGFIVVLTMYVVVNQYEAIRFLGARSEWDFKMATLVAAVATAICLWFNVTMGPLAHADFPELLQPDQAYPLMVAKYLPPGLVGLVMAGVIAGGYSTFDSIGIGISSLFVRDIYARFIVRNETDAHYTRAGRITVPIIIALGFAYVPFIQEGMLLFYLRLAGAIAVPLMTVVLMGVFTRVHRATGIIGLLVGLAYGTTAILAERYDWGLPVWYTHTWWAYLWNIVFPAAAMLIASRIITGLRGRATDQELQGLVFARAEHIPDLRDRMAHRLHALEGTWLQRTLAEAPVRPEYPIDASLARLTLFRRPGFLVIGYLVLVSYLLFGVLW